MEDFYPMPLFVKLLVRDVTTSAKWYEDALGFRSVYALAGENSTQVLNHLRLGRYQDLMLIAQPQSLSESNKGQGVVINLTIDKELDSLAQQAALLRHRQNLWEPQSKVQWRHSGTHRK